MDKLNRLGIGEGFTDEEVDISLDPLKRSFNPEHEYEPYDIGTLSSGPQAVTFVGRVVNCNVHHGRSKSQSAARGWHHMIVKDDTGAIHVTLYFSHRPYALKLGLLVSIWTPFISRTHVAEAFLMPNTKLSTSIFPGRDPTVHLILHQHSDAGGSCRAPLLFHSGYPLPGLVSVQTLLEVIDDLPESRVLVFVKSIGSEKTITTKKGDTVKLQEVLVCDETAAATLKLWNEANISARDWRPSTTVLLISSPRVRSEGRRANIGLAPETMVDVDPDFPDAHWLRRYAVAQTRSENVSQVFPDEVWDIKTAVEAPVRILFTIADLDEWARNNPGQIFTGFLSLIIIDLSLSLHLRRNMLMCNECCGIPIYTNDLQTRCRSCHADVDLYLNPKIMGSLVDETGCLGAGTLLWRRGAWEQLLGRSVEKLADMGDGEMKALEQRLLFMRFTLVFGWAEEVARVAVLAVLE